MRTCARRCRGRWSEEEGKSKGCVGLVGRRVGESIAGFG